MSYLRMGKRFSALGSLDRGAYQSGIFKVYGAIAKDKNLSPLEAADILEAVAVSFPESPRDNARIALKVKGLRSDDADESKLTLDGLKRDFNALQKSISEATYMLFQMLDNPKSMRYIAAAEGLIGDICNRIGISPVSTSVRVSMKGDTFEGFQKMVSGAMKSYFGDSLAFQGVNIKPDANKSFVDITGLYGPYIGKVYGAFSRRTYTTPYIEFEPCEPGEAKVVEYLVSNDIPAGAFTGEFGPPEFDKNVVFRKPEPRPKTNNDHILNEPSLFAKNDRPSRSSLGRAEASRSSEMSI